MFGEHKDIFEINAGLSIPKCDLVQSFKQWSEFYISSADLAAIHIAKNHHRNSVVDYDSLPTLFMYRHSLELLLKSKIIDSKGKNQSKAVFKKFNHDLHGLFNEVDLEGICLSMDFDWFTKFFNNINTFDFNSDLFRYPFSSEFLELYKNKYLDTLLMFGLLSSVYNVLYFSFFDCKFDEEVSIEECVNFINNNSENGEFIHLAQHGNGNCYLWQSKTLDSFKQINGYHSIANLLYKEYSKTKSVTYFVPMVFIYRNLIELIIKDFGQNLHPYIKDEIEQDYLATIKAGYLKTHRIKKGLWKNYKVIFIAFAKIYNWELSDLDVIEEYIQSLDSFDKHSDKFRYPTNLNLDFCHDDEYDPDTIHHFMEELYELFDGMIMVLQETSDNVNDMLSAYSIFNDY